MSIETHIGTMARLVVTALGRSCSTEAVVYGDGGAEYGSEHFLESGMRIYRDDSLHITEVLSRLDGTESASTIRIYEIGQRQDADPSMPCRGFPREMLVFEAHGAAAETYTPGTWEEHLEGLVAVRDIQ